MTRQPEPTRRRARTPTGDRAAQDDDVGELALAQTLIALHRSERAPRAVSKQVQARLASEDERPVRLSWTQSVESALVQISGWPLAAVVAALVISLATWPHQQTEAAWPEVAEVSEELSITGVPVPGSLQLRLHGDQDGMGICEGHFLLDPDGSRLAAPVRVNWTRCDLPDTVADELRRVFSPVHEARPLSILVRGRWARTNEFEALGLRQLP